MAQTIELESISRLDIKPGEMLVVTLREGTTPKAMQRVRDTLLDFVPADVKLLIVSHSVDLSVLCPPSPACPAAD